MYVIHKGTYKHLIDTSTTFQAAFTYCLTTINALVSSLDFSSWPPSEFRKLSSKY